MQRLEAVGQLTSGVAHDFNNLLTVVLGNIGFIERAMDAAGIDGKTAQRLGYMRAAAERGAKLTDQLLSFSRRQRLEPKVIDLNDTIAGMRDLLQSTIGGSVRIETQLGDELWPALVDPTQLDIAVLNLAINARDAMEIGGTLKVATANVRLRPAALGRGAGGGRLRRHLRQRHRLRHERRRARESVRAVLHHQGDRQGVRSRSQPGARLRQAVGRRRAHRNRSPAAAPPSPFSCRGPRRRHDARPQSPRAAASAPRPGAVILLVDDDAAVRDVTAAMLRDLGYTVREAASGEGALALLDDEARIDLAVIDFAMPVMSGAELARHVRAKRPALPVLFVTGFAEREALSGISDRHIVSKPFVTGELAEKVQAGAGRYGLTLCRGAAAKRRRRGCRGAA